MNHEIQRWPTASDLLAEMRELKLAHAAKVGEMQAEIDHLKAQIGALKAAARERQEAAE